MKSVDAVTDAGSMISFTRSQQWLYQTSPRGSKSCGRVDVKTNSGPRDTMKFRNGKSG